LLAPAVSLVSNESGGGVRVGEGWARGSVKIFLYLID
jgi:hypothetical protein